MTMEKVDIIDMSEIEETITFKNTATIIKEVHGITKCYIKQCQISTVQPVTTKLNRLIKNLKTSWKNRQEVRNLKNPFWEFQGSNTIRLGFRSQWICVC